MAPSQPGLHGNRKGSTGSTASRPSFMDQVAPGVDANPNSTGDDGGEERRPSAGSGYFSPHHYDGRINSDHGSFSSTSSSVNILGRSPNGHADDRQRPYNARTYAETHTQMPVVTGGPRRKHHKESNEPNSLFSFFRNASSSSRPPSPDQLDTFYSNSHTRKTSFNGYSTSTNAGISYTNNNGNSNGNVSNQRNQAMAGSLHSNSSSITLNNGAHANNNNNTIIAGTSSYIPPHHNVKGQSQRHPFDTGSERRRSIESYSRSPLPDPSSLPDKQQQMQMQMQQQQQQQQQQQTGRQVFPASPPSQIRPHQRTDSMRNMMNAQHRRTKSSDYGDVNLKRAGQQQEYEAPSQVVSPAKETKKNIFSLFKKKALSSHHHHGSQQQQQNPQHYLQQQHYQYQIEIDLNDMSGIKEGHAHWLPLNSAGGAESWRAPESWGVQPPLAQPVGLPRPLAMTQDEEVSEDMDQSDLENWDYGKKKLSTIRIFRPDTTYTTVNCVFNITASELSTILGKKIFKPDTSKYRLYVLRNNIVRPLGTHERPLNILRKCLLQFGYTDQDKLEELSGKDNSFICRFTFAENGAPLITEADFPENTKYADVNLQRRCLPTIPIFLYSRAKDIVRLNISYNQRMDLPLDFVQICSVLRELRMAYNDLGRVPSNVRSIIYLQVLDLRGNRIKDLSKARLEDSRELTTLYLQSNRLETIPESFQSFEYLRILNLSTNNFSEVPMVLFEIVTLEELDMSFNEITEVPEGIGRLTRLRTLLLFGNWIGPHLPTTMSDLIRLRKLDIRQNRILNLDAVNDLPSLEELLVDYNTNVVLNISFKALSKLSLLKCNMTDINIRGTAGTLTVLDLSSNMLSRLESTFFEHLQSLETLKLDNNSISSIPGAVGSLKRLKFLSIANNLLSCLPDDIGQMESLVELDVHSNSIGELPVSIWKISLIALNASSNLLESFPDPPRFIAPTNVNGGHLSASSSTTTLCDADNTQAPSITTTAPSPPRSKPLPAPSVHLQGTPSGRTPYVPPLAISLRFLCLGDNRFPDEIMYPLSHFSNLQMLNLSHNYIAEIPRGKIPNPGQIVELYLGGNQLTSLPAEDIEKLRNLRVLHVNGNKLTTLPAELGKINRLGVLDVGCNMLKYNISNWPYDWNWNWNLELKYLNMSGNKRLQIKRQSVDGVPAASSRPGNLSEFGNLTRLQILGLMDVTITDNVPENSVDRRVRTSMSTLHNMSYGMADTLGDSDNLCIWDLVHPKFQTKEDESLFGLFDGRGDRYRANCSMTSYLKDRFGSYLKIELEKLEGTDTVVSALRRTFLGLDRDLWPLTQDEGGKGGASALVAYIKGVTLYSANVGDAIAVLVKKSDTYQVISQKHIPWNPTEASRIKHSGGFVSENGLLNDELDISRSFGQYHLVPIVNSNPFIETTTLSEDDDFLIMASNAFWGVMSYATAVDIAKAAKRDYGDLMYASQKLRDIAVSYGARDHMVVMLIGVGDLFKKKEPRETSEYHQQNYKRPKAPEGPADTLKDLKPEIEPPQGDVAMVFTDIKNSTKLWENIPIAMAIAIKEHFNVMRRQLRSIGGYEVKNEGDALMASFSSVPAAMLWCFKVQELLVNADWPQDILDSNECKAIFNATDLAQPMYRGLSVRMGIHWGRPVSDRDAVTRRMDYYGPMVNRAARICDSADGGEICVSSDVINMMQHLFSDTELEHSDSPDAEHVRELKTMGFGIIELGEKKLKGLETPENLHLIYSRLLAGRMAMDPLRGIPETPIMETQLVESTVALDSASVRALQLICLRLERLASGATAQHGRVPDQTLALLSLPVKDNADQDELSRVAEHYITRLENCFSQLYMVKSGHFMDVFESLGRAIDTDPSYILRALQMYVSIMGGLDAPNLL
ncbi:cysteinyl-tRNA synthetase [Mortierella polycephala]|uniref:Adenylate cyclase n=1 Tax=Mortierella polycephala TaxID=41804 RepID=A0A9P6U2Y1_9FUNG|nr:cysteinyl-tRNA synthetase [Mortierella polycephala]